MPVLLPPELFQTMCPIQHPVVQVYAGLNQRTGELMAVKVLELVTKHKAGLQSTVMQQLQELQQVGLCV